MQLMPKACIGQRAIPFFHQKMKVFREQTCAYLMYKCKKGPYVL